MKGRLLALPAILLGLCLVVGNPAQSIAAEAALSPDEFKEVTEADIAFLKEGLSAKSIDLRKLQGTLFGTAMLIAYNAQQQMLAGNNPKEMATLRDAALAVVEQISDKKHADALKLAQDLKVAMAADPKADTKPVTLKGLHRFELYELMQPFRLDKTSTGRVIGGRGLEKAVRDYMEVEGIADPKKAREIALRIIPVAELTLEFTPTRKEGTKDPADWKKFTEEMKKYSRDAADALKGNDKAAAAKAFENLDNSCTRCHNVFRD